MTCACCLCMPAPLSRLFVTYIDLRMLDQRQQPVIGAEAPSGDSPKDEAQVS